jgi:hypothetical protein
MDILQCVWLALLTGYLVGGRYRASRQTDRPASMPPAATNAVRMIAKLTAKRAQYREFLARLQSPDAGERVAAAKALIQQRAREREAS